MSVGLVTLMCCAGTINGVAPAISTSVRIQLFIHKHEGTSCQEHY